MNNPSMSQRRLNDLSLMSIEHKCRNKQIFGGAKDFRPNFPKLAQKVVVQLLPTVFAV